MGSPSYPTGGSSQTPGPRYIDLFRTLSVCLTNIMPEKNVLHGKLPILPTCKAKCHNSHAVSFHGVPASARKSDRCLLPLCLPHICQMTSDFQHHVVKFVRHGGTPLLWEALAPTNTHNEPAAQLLLTQWSQPYSHHHMWGHVLRVALNGTEKDCLGKRGSSNPKSPCIEDSELLPANLLQLLYSKV